MEETARTWQMASCLAKADFSSPGLLRSRAISASRSRSTCGSITLALGSASSPLSALHQDGLIRSATMLHC